MASIKLITSYIIINYINNYYNTVVLNIIIYAYITEYHYATITITRYISNRVSIPFALRTPVYSRRPPPKPVCLLPVFSPPR